MLWSRITIISKTPVELPAFLFSGNKLISPFSREFIRMEWRLLYVYTVYTMMHFDIFASELSFTGYYHLPKPEKNV